MKLNYRTYGEGEPLFILHGVFGSLDNWYTLGKELSKSYAVYLIDLRNHGQSPHSETFNYSVMAEDILELLRELKLSSIYLMGHSMGGKVAMQIATTNPELIKKLIVVDIGPKAYPPHHKEIYEGFRSIDLTILENRTQADEQLSKKINDFGVRQFILKNLTRSEEGGFSWKLNLDAIEKNASKIGEALSKDSVYEKPTLFIGGANSKYILETDYEGIRHHFPEVSIKIISGAGHWVHAEKPKEMYTLVTTFLNS